MSEIPEDIAVVSSEVLTKIFGGSDDVTHEDWQTIARAILAERERCAKIAASASEHLSMCLERSSGSDHDVAVFESAISAANAIAVTIRTPTKQ